MNNYIFSFIIAFASTLSLIAGENWPGLNKDGRNSNSNASGIGPSPKLAWSKTFEGFESLQNDATKYGRRSHALCIRDGEALILGPDWDRRFEKYPAGSPRKLAPPEVLRISLADGSIKSRYYLSFADTQKGLCVVVGDVLNTTTKFKTKLVKVGGVGATQQFGNLFVLDGNYYPIASHDQVTGIVVLTKPLPAIPADGLEFSLLCNGMPYHSCATGFAGLAGCDLKSGLTSMFWADNGTVYCSWGGDWGGTYSFRADTGERVPERIYRTGDNSSGYFVMSDDGKYFIGGGSQSHDSASTGWQRQGWPADYSKAGEDARASFYAECQGWNSSSLLDGKLACDFNCWNYKTLNEGYGTIIRAWDLSASKTDPLTGITKISLLSPGKYENKFRSYLGFGLVHAEGAPRALCVTESGQVCYWGFDVRGTPGNYGKPTATSLYIGSQSPDDTKPMSLTVLTKGTLVEQANIPTTWKYVTNYGTLYPTYVFRLYHSHLAPQIATLGKYVVVFQPQQSNLELTQARLFCFDIELKRLAWEYTYPAKQFVSEVRTELNQPPNEQAVQMTIAGGQVIVGEAYIDPATKKSMFRMYRHELSIGAISGEDLRYEIKKDDGASISGGYFCGLREFAGVDGNLLALVDWRLPDTYVGTVKNYGLCGQSLLAIRSGDVVIPPPVPPLPTPEEIDAAIRVKVSTVMAGKLYKTVAEVIQDLQAIP